MQRTQPVPCMTWYVQGKICHCLLAPASKTFQSLVVSKAVAAAKRGQGGKKGKAKAEGIQSRLGIRATAAAEFCCLF